MQVLRLDGLPAVPWKNGGGSTREYAMHPPGAGTGSFAWRISRARVESDGPFSVFPGIDRTLTVVEGGAIDLLFDDRRIRLDLTTPPYPFRGDDRVDGRIPGEPIEDLNVMTLRGRWRHTVDRRLADTAIALDLTGTHSFVVAAGPLRAVAPDHAPVELADGDAIRFDAPATVRLEPIDGPAPYIVVRLDPVEVPQV